MTDPVNNNFRKKGKLFLRPRNLVLGIGCNSGTSADEIESAVKKALDENNLSFLSVRSVATIHIKADEPGVRKFCRKHTFRIHSFTPEELNRVEGVARSEAAFRATGAKAVAEPAALLAAGADTLLVRKQKIGNVTVAAAEIKKGVSAVGKRESGSPGKIFVVGTGPGDISHITPYAQQAIRGSDIIVGYGTYIELIKDLLRGREVFSTGMTQEIDRCRKAVELALSGRTVSVISGGDPGIYAMAGLVFELLRQRSGTAPLPAVEVIPGISALNACAARLGAPLMHDFASISLSDRLTPWDLIEQRLDAAAMADFVIILYNPKSKGRKEQISKAREIVMKYRNPDTPVGIVRGAMRENEVVIVTDLKRMLDHEIDMQTSVIIGNTNTLVWNDLMITPRGYEKKRQYRIRTDD
jgi:cobalt-precorrin 5A hydrolase/precorrin-3B C17-methyltransferase